MQLNGRAAVALCIALPIAPFIPSFVRFVRELYGWSGLLREIMKELREVIEGKRTVKEAPRLIHAKELLTSEEASGVLEAVTAAVLRGLAKTRSSDGRQTAEIPTEQIKAMLEIILTPDFSRPLGDLATRVTAGAVVSYVKAAAATKREDLEQERQRSLSLSKEDYEREIARQNARERDFFRNACSILEVPGVRQGIADILARTSSASTTAYMKSVEDDETMPEGLLAAATKTPQREAFLKDLVCLVIREGIAAKTAAEELQRAGVSAKASSAGKGVSSGGDGSGAQGTGDEKSSIQAVRDIVGVLAASKENRRLTLDVTSAAVRAGTSEAVHAFAEAVGGRLRRRQKHVPQARETSENSTAGRQRNRVRQLVERNDDEESIGVVTDEEETDGVMGKAVLLAGSVVAALGPIVYAISS